MTDTLMLEPWLVLNIVVSLLVYWSIREAMRQVAMEVVDGD